MIPYAIIGYDGDLRMVIETEGWPIVGYVATEPMATDLPYLGDDDSADWATLSRARLLVAVDPPELRARLFDRYRDFNISGFVSARATVAPSARIAGTAIIQAGCLVSEGAVVEAATKVNIDARLHHHSRLGEGSVLAPGARLLGAVSVGRGCYIGADATIRQHLTIGDGSTIGMGAVVVSDMPAGVVAYGNPATPRAKPGPR